MCLYTYTEHHLAQAAISTGTHGGNSERMNFKHAGGALAFPPWQGVCLPSHTSALFLQPLCASPVCIDLTLSEVLYHACINQLMTNNKWFCDFGEGSFQISWFSHVVMFTFYPDCSTGGRMRRVHSLSWFLFVYVFFFYFLFPLVSALQRLFSQ